MSLPCDLGGPYGGTKSEAVAQPCCRKKAVGIARAGQDVSRDGVFGACTHEEARRDIPPRLHADHVGNLMPGHLIGAYVRTVDGAIDRVGFFRTIAELIFEIDRKVLEGLEIETGRDRQQIGRRHGDLIAERRIDAIGRGGGAQCARTAGAVAPAAIIEAQTDRRRGAIFAQTIGLRQEYLPGGNVAIAK